MKSTTIICSFILLLAACKKSNSDNSSPAPLQAKLNGKLVKVNHLLTNPDIHYNNMTLLGMYGPIAGDTSNALSITVAYQDIGKGETVDLATDGQGKAFISYQNGNNDIYGAGTGWASSSGKVTLTLNNQMQRRIEGTFSAVLVNGNNTSQTMSITDGQFSASY